ncbi:hypothetical protein LTR66_006973 [Elasticomyces elasticus]|nr:hypothetical protein LTR66_006973 [Elasticomyces elasticus]
MDYGPNWRGIRKLVHQHFMEGVVERDHLGVQNAEAVQMMRDYLERPEEHMLHPKRFSNSIIMSLLWGIRTPTPSTPHMTRLYALMEVWSKVMEPGNTPPVDIYPFLHYIPERFLGNWVSRATHVKREMNALYNDFLTGIEARRKSSGRKDCLMDRVLDQNEKSESPYNRHQLYFMGGTMTEGGSDTSSSIIIAFVQAMVKWPEIQKRAQIEIDGVVGEDRSLVWGDYAKLPYVAATVKEAMRWRPVTPLAFPHALSEDDWVDGYFLPAGTTVIINAWGLHHDPDRFTDPEVFDPDHYAGVTALAPELATSADYSKRDHYGYGSGRRLCPGIHLAERNLFLAMAKLLWAFEFKDKKGKEVDVDPVTGYSEGFLVCAEDFECEISVRGEKRRETILREFEEAERDVFARFDAE